MEKKKTFKLVQIVPLFMGMFCVLLFNSVLIIKDAKSGLTMSYANNTVFSPWQLNDNGHKVHTLSPSLNKETFAAKTTYKETPSTGDVKIDITNFSMQPEAAEPLPPVNNDIVPVGFDAVDGSLTKEQKDNVKSTIAATKKVAGTLQWKEIEKSIGEVMDSKEKMLAKREYLNELEKVNWNTIEQNMKANYDKVNWEAVQHEINKAMVQVQMDSIHTVYVQALAEVEKAEQSLQTKNRCAATPMPDASVEELKAAKVTLQRSLDSLKASQKQKKVVAL